MWSHPDVDKSAWNWLMESIWAGIVTGGTHLYMERSDSLSFTTLSQAVKNTPSQTQEWYFFIALHIPFHKAENKSWSSCFLMPHPHLLGKINIKHIQAFYWKIQFVSALSLCLLYLSQDSKLRQIPDFWCHRREIQAVKSLEIQQTDLV